MGIMNYLFKFHKNDYAWNVYDPNPELPEHRVPGLTELKDSNKMLSDEEQKAIFHVATHWKYTYNVFGEKFESVMKNGVCLTYSNDKTLASVYHSRARSLASNNA